MIKRLLSSQFHINIVTGTATTFVNLVVLAVAYPVYVQFLGYEAYGVWLILATVLCFAQIGNLGISSAVIKLVAEEYGRGNVRGIQSYVSTAIAILLFSGTLVLVLILVFQNQIISAFNLSGQNALVAARFLPYIGVLSISAMLVQSLNAVISGLGRLDIANYILSGGRVVTVGTSSVFLWLGNHIESLLIGDVLSYVFVGAASVFVIRRIVNIRLLRMSNLDSRSLRKLLRFGGGVFGSSLISMFLHPFNKLMLSRYGAISSIPIYEMAYSGSVHIRGLMEAGLQALTPEISRIAANVTSSTRDTISRINRRAMKLILLFGTPAYGVMIVCLTPLLKLWLRGGFVDELPVVFGIMLVSAFLSLLGVPAYYTIIGLGKVRYLLESTIIGASVNVVSVTTYYALTKHLSVYSVGLCMAMSFAAGAAYLICKVRHLLAVARYAKEK